eukprot:IDg18879t1
MTRAGAATNLDLNTTAILKELLTEIKALREDNAQIRRENTLIRAELTAIRNANSVRTTLEETLSPPQATTEESRPKTERPATQSTQHKTSPNNPDSHQMSWAEAVRRNASVSKLHRETQVKMKQLQNDMNAYRPAPPPCK